MRIHSGCITGSAEEEGCRRPGTEGESVAAACTECAEESLHLGHGIDILLHLCRQTGSHLVVCVLLDEGERALMVHMPRVADVKHHCFDAASMMPALLLQTPTMEVQNLHKFHHIVAGCKFDRSIVLNNTPLSHVL